MCGIISQKINLRTNTKRCLEPLIIITNLILSEKRWNKKIHLKFFVTFIINFTQFNLKKRFESVTRKNYAA